MGWTETVQYFAGGTLARHSEKRTDSAFISAALTDPATKFIAYDAELNALLTAGQGSRIAFLSHADVKPLIDLNGERAFEGNGRACQWLFLGVEEVEGKPDVACFAIDVGKPQDEAAEGAAPKIEAISALEQLITSKFPEGTAFHPFRPHSFLLPMHEGAAVGTGRAVLEWNRSAKFCPACGQRTISEEAGWKRICPKPPADTDRSKMCPARRSTQAYTHPRLDNSIIVAIASADGERIMLGRKKRSPPKFFSCVAGFQEPGESIEECVRREAREETGLRLAKVIYHSSQPWPMPSQLMIGCLAVVEGNETFRPEEEEFVEARWFTRDEVIPALERSGTVNMMNPPADVPFLVPPAWAIAHFIIKAWAMREIDVLNFDSGSSTSAKI